jgi:hypothetical protein
MQKTRVFILLNSQIDLNVDSTKVGGQYGFTDPITIPYNKVVSLGITHDYDRNISPSISLISQVETVDYEQIILNMNTLTATFSLSRVLVSENSTEGSYDQQVEIFNTTFKSLNQDNADIIRSEDISITDKNDDNKMKSRTQELNLFLYDYKKIEKLRKYKSFNLTASMNYCLFQLLSSRGFDNVLMSPVNDTSDVDFYIPYGNLNNNLKFLNNYYGIYDGPYLFYMDIDSTYLIDKSKLGYTLRRNELGGINIYLEDPTKNNMSNTGSYKDETSGLYILNSTPVNINDMDSLIDYESAGKVTSIQNGTLDIKSDIIGDYSIERAFITDNPKEHEYIKYNIDESKRVITTVFADMDLSIISPNKSYRIISDDNYYDTKNNINGYYRLSKSLILLSNTTDYGMKCSIETVLSKVKER